MNSRPGPLSPESMNGSQWNEPPYSPSLSTNRGHLVTPPISGSSNGTNGSYMNGMPRKHDGSPGNPSPPSSVARSSNGTVLSEHQARKARLMEESLARHYVTLKRYLADALRDDKVNPKTNRARDKLLRLSTVQVQELSTDVNDELLRRQHAARPGGEQVPPHLVPRENFHPKRNGARQKLATLPASRFRDLATDVFYELERRYPHFIGSDVDRVGSPANSMRGPPSRAGTPNGIRPSSRGQGQARPGPGGIGYLPPRQVSLSGQVMAGLGIPGVEGHSDAYGRPTAKTFQSSTIIPNKSTLVEDDDDQTGPEDDDMRSEIYSSRRDTNNTSMSISIGGAESKRKIIQDFQTQIDELQGKIDQLEGKVRDKDTEIGRLQKSHKDQESAHSNEQKETADLRASLEHKLADAVKLNNSLQYELNKVKSHHTDTERDLRSQLEEAAKRGSGDNAWKSKFENMDRDYQDLHNQLREQQQVTDEVKEEASMFLNEMKALSERSDQTWAREEKLAQQVYKLQDEVQQWKSRYARTKTQLRSLRASSIGLSIQQADVREYAKEGGFTEENGLVKDVHVTKFQIAIDELLHIARVGEPQSVLDYVKSVVVAIRHIIQDIGDTTSSEDPLAQQRHKLKTRVSATANNIITAAKNFATSNGISPVSLLDAAASHLTTAIVELIRTVKIRHTPAGELEDDDDGNLPADSPGYPGARSSTVDSVYSVLSTPPKHPPRTRAHGRQDSWATKARHSAMNGDIAPLPKSTSGNQLLHGGVGEVEVRWS